MTADTDCSSALTRRSYSDPATTNSVPQNHISNSQQLSVTGITTSSLIPTQEDDDDDGIVGRVSGHLDPKEESTQNNLFVSNQHLLDPSRDGLSQNVQGDMMSSQAITGRSDYFNYISRLNVSHHQFQSQPTPSLFHDYQERQRRFQNFYGSDVDDCGVDFSEHNIPFASSHPTQQLPFPNINRLLDANLFPGLLRARMIDISGQPLDLQHQPVDFSRSSLERMGGNYAFEPQCNINRGGNVEGDVVTTISTNNDNTRQLQNKLLNISKSNNNVKSTACYTIGQTDTTNCLNNDNNTNNRHQDSSCTGNNHNTNNGDRNNTGIIEGSTNLLDDGGDNNHSGSQIVLPSRNCHQQSQSQSTLGTRFTLETNSNIDQEIHHTHHNYNFFSNGHSTSHPLDIRHHESQEHQAIFSSSGNSTNPLFPTQQLQHSQLMPVEAPTTSSSMLTSTYPNPYGTPFLSQPISPPKSTTISKPTSPSTTISPLSPDDSVITGLLRRENETLSGPVTMGNSTFMPIASNGNNKNSPIISCQNSDSRPTNESHVGNHLIGEERATRIFQTSTTDTGFSSSTTALHPRYTSEVPPHLIPASTVCLHQGQHIQNDIYPSNPILDQNRFLNSAPSRGRRPRTGTPPPTSVLGALLHRLFQIQKCQGNNASTTVKTQRKGDAIAYAVDQLSSSELLQLMKNVISFQLSTKTSSDTNHTQDVTRGLSNGERLNTSRNVVGTGGEWDYSALDNVSRIFCADLDTDAIIEELFNLSGIPDRKFLRSIALWCQQQSPLKRPIDMTPYQDKDKNNMDRLNRQPVIPSGLRIPPLAYNSRDFIDVHSKQNIICDNTPLSNDIGLLSYLSQDDQRSNTQECLNRYPNCSPSVSLSSPDPPPLLSHNETPTATSAAFKQIAPPPLAVLGTVIETIFSKLHLLQQAVLAQAELQTNTLAALVETQLAMIRGNRSPILFKDSLCKVELSPTESTNLSATYADQYPILNNKDNASFSSSGKKRLRYCNDSSFDTLPSISVMHECVVEEPRALKQFRTVDDTTCQTPSNPLVCVKTETTISHISLLPSPEKLDLPQIENPSTHSAVFSHAPTSPIVEQASVPSSSLECTKDLDNLCEQSSSINNEQENITEFKVDQDTSTADTLYSSAQEGCFFQNHHNSPLISFTFDNQTRGMNETHSTEEISVIPATNVTTESTSFSHITSNITDSNPTVEMCDNPLSDNDYAYSERTPSSSPNAHPVSGYTPPNTTNDSVGNFSFSQSNTFKDNVVTGISSTHSIFSTNDNERHSCNDISYHQQCLLQLQALALATPQWASHQESYKWHRAQLDSIPFTSSNTNSSMDDIADVLKTKSVIKTDLNKSRTDEYLRLFLEDLSSLDQITTIDSSDHLTGLGHLRHRSFISQAVISIVSPVEPILDKTKGCWDIAGISDSDHVKILPSPSAHQVRLRLKQAVELIPVWLTRLDNLRVSRDTTFQPLIALPSFLQAAAFSHFLSSLGPSLIKQLQQFQSDFVKPWKESFDLSNTAYMVTPNLMGLPFQHCGGRGAVAFSTPPTDSKIKVKGAENSSHPTLLRDDFIDEMITNDNNFRGAWKEEIDSNTQTSCQIGKQFQTGVSFPYHNSSSAPLPNLMLLGQVLNNHFPSSVPRNAPTASENDTFSSPRSRQDNRMGYGGELNYSLNSGGLRMFPSQQNNSLSVDGSPSSCFSSPCGHSPTLNHLGSASDLSSSTGTTSSDSLPRSTNLISTQCQKSRPSINSLNISKDLDPSNTHHSLIVDLASSQSCSNLPCPSLCLSQNIHQQPTTPASPSPLLLNNSSEATNLPLRNSSASPTSSSATAAGRKMMMMVCTAKPTAASTVPSFISQNDDVSSTESAGARQASSWGLPLISPNQESLGHDRNRPKHNSLINTTSNDKLSPNDISLQKLVDPLGKPLSSNSIIPSTINNLSHLAKGCSAQSMNTLEPLATEPNVLTALSHRSGNVRHTAVQGVLWKPEDHAWVAFWQDPITGLQQIRRFLVSEYGVEGAKKMAMKCRREADRQLTAAVRVNQIATVSVSPRNTAISKDNTQQALQPPRSEVPGVYWYRNRNGWVAQWFENGKNKHKFFAASVFGVEGAKQKAIAYRLMKLEEKRLKGW